MAINTKISQWEHDVFFGAPTFDDSTLEYCKESGDWMPVAFEWYKYAAILLCRFAEFGTNTDQGLVDRPNRHHAILRGLMLRSSRLMLGGVSLASEARNGDMLMALGRMAIESMVKCRWLIKIDSPDMFDRFIRSGLKKDVELQVEIKKINQSLGGECNLTSRLQKNISAAFEISGVSESEVLESKKMPSYKQMLESLRLDSHYLYYQSIPSSQIHGDWSDLMAHHLEYDYEFCRFNIKSSHNEPNARACFVVTSFSLETLKDYIEYNIIDKCCEGFINLIRITKEEYEKLYLNPVLKQDFKGAW